MSGEPTATATSFFILHFSIFISRSAFFIFTFSFRGSAHFSFFTFHLKWRVVRGVSARRFTLRVSARRRDTKPSPTRKHNSVRNRVSLRREKWKSGIVEWWKGYRSKNTVAFSAPRLGLFSNDGTARIVASCADEKWISRIESQFLNGNFLSQTSS